MANLGLDVNLTSINGRCGDKVYYSVWNKGYMRRYVIPHNPKSEAQEAHRSLFAEAMAEWKLLSKDEQKYYIKKTRRLAMHPHNLFIQQYIELMKNKKKAADLQPAEPEEPVSTEDNRPIENNQPCTQSEASLYGLCTTLQYDSGQVNHSLYSPPE